MKHAPDVRAGEGLNVSLGALVQGSKNWVSVMPPGYDPYGVFGVLYSTSFCNGFHTVS